MPHWLINHKQGWHKMKKNSHRVEKLLNAFFESNTVHNYPVIRIEKEMRSTYDGVYPYFGLVYDAMTYNNEPVDELIDTINNYTGLREGRDYWLGVTWEFIEE